MMVLIVDDDAVIRRLTRERLEARGMVVAVAETVAEAKIALGKRDFAVVILDLTLADGSGLEVLDGLREVGSTTHVIVLSGSTGEADRVEALQRGADDYVVKPFYMRELAARVEAVGRRRDAIADAAVTIGDIDIDLRARRVLRAGEPVELTTKEFDLLAYLAVRPGHVFDREHLLNVIWRSASEWQQAATVTEHIHRLRRKIEVDPTHPELLITVRRAGYRLDLPPAHGAEQVEEAHPPAPGEIIHVDGVVVFCDEGAARLVGASDPAAVVGSHLTALVTPGSVPAARRHAEAEAAVEVLRSELVEFRRGDAGEVTAAVQSTSADWNGAPARRLRLTPINAERDRLRQLVIGVIGEVSDAVVITDLYFHIRSWNAAAQRLYGWSEDQVLGRHVLDVLHWADDAQLAHMWERLEHAGRWHGESEQLTSDGSVVDVLGSTTLIRDLAGDPIGIVSVNRPALDAVAVRSVGYDMATAARMRQGLDDDEFEVVYQPVVDLVDGRLASVEALVRWRHPELGMLAPADFLDTAERSGVIVELGERVLDEACRQAAAWRRSGSDIHLSVNVSTRQLADPAMFDRFHAVIDSSGLEPSALWLEVTETSLVEELEQADRVLRRLVDFGVGVAIDDFGTGWASLTYLRNFPVHSLKIDRSFVSGAGANPHDTAIIRSILSLGSELDLFVVAEGIETPAQLDLLKQLGCSLGQGYLFGRPTPAREVQVDRAGRWTPIDRPDRSSPDAAAIGSAGPSRRLRRPSGTTETSGLTADGFGLDSDVVTPLLRNLLRVSSAPAAVDLLHRTIRGMGGTIVPVGEAGRDSLAVDVSLGLGPPMLVEVERVTVARMHLERLLPLLVEDTRRAVDLLRRADRVVGES